VCLPCFEIKLLYQVSASQLEAAVSSLFLRYNQPVAYSAQKKLMTETIQGEPYHYYPLGKYVVRALGVCGGRPTFKYTRIEIIGTFERLAAGETIEDIVIGYKGKVSKEAIEEATKIVTAQFLHSLPKLAA
jgi:uncharacterized protein (DUF433 family)